MYESKKSRKFLKPFIDVIEWFRSGANKTTIHCCGNKSVIYLQITDMQQFLSFPTEHITSMQFTPELSYTFSGRAI